MRLRRRSPPGGTNLFRIRPRRTKPRTSAGAALLQAAPTLLQTAPTTLGPTINAASAFVQTAVAPVAAAPMNFALGNLSSLLTDASIRALLALRSTESTIPTSTAVAYMLLSQVLVSSTLGLSAFQVFKNFWENIEDRVIQTRDPSQLASGGMSILYGVDVSASLYLQHPEVLEAAHYAAQCHAGQVRLTGELYVAHVVETAKIVEALLPRGSSVENQKDRDVIIAALLHDVIDDAGVSRYELEKRFGAHVGSMVDGVTQMSTVLQLVRRRRRISNDADPYQDATFKENLLDLCFSVSDNAMVTLIKLADRLHNMRTLFVLKETKQRAVATETLHVWCGIAERLGLFSLKAELEDLCFAALEPQLYDDVRQQRDALLSIEEEAAAPPPPAAPAPLAQPSLNLFYDPTGAFISSGLSEVKPSKDAAAAATSAGEFDPLGFHQDEISPSEFAAAVLEGLEARTDGGATASTSASASADVTAVQDADPQHSAASSELAAATLFLAKPAPKAASYSFPSADPPPPPPPRVLSPEQEAVRKRLESVVPFDALVFRTRAQGSKLLQDLDAVAVMLFREIGSDFLTSGLQVYVSGRLKSVYSIHKKMQRKRVPIDEIYDVRALRVVVDDERGKKVTTAVAACYRLLPLVQRIWRPIPGECDDYIAHPKPSGYQSLHTAVMGPGGAPLEVQIRTSTLHEEAEIGRAAHWAYKEAPAAGAPLPALFPATAAAAAPLNSDGSDTEADLLHRDLDFYPGDRVLRIEDARVRDAVVVASEPRAVVIEVAQSGVLEEYRLSKDRLWHRHDYLGRRSTQTLIIPIRGKLRSMIERPAAADDAPSPGPRGPAAAPLRSDEEDGLASQAEAETDLYFEDRYEPLAGKAAASQVRDNRTRALRALLESDLALQKEGRESPGEADGLAGAIAEADVILVLMPECKIVRLPRGSTAADALETFQPDAPLFFSTSASAGRPGAGAGPGRGGRSPLNAQQQRIRSGLAVSTPRPASLESGLSLPLPSGDRRGHGAKFTRLVNVNRKLVGADYVLKDGDLVFIEP